MGLFSKKKQKETVQVPQEFLDRVYKELKIRDEAIKAAVEAISAQEELLGKATNSVTKLLAENTKLKNTIDRMHEAIANEKK